MKKIKAISLLILGPLFSYRFFLCPFRMPYLYCFICPIRCVWYRIRGWVLLLALGLNIRRGLFCNQLCPFGTIQVLLSKIVCKKIQMPKLIPSFKYIGLVLILLIIMFTKTPVAFGYKFIGLLSSQILITKMKWLLLGIFLLGMVLSIFSYRFFCFSLCPFRALSIFGKTKDLRG